MRYEKWKTLSARQKAFWPAQGKFYLHPQHRVSVSIDAELAEWLIENVVGGGSYNSDLEETIITVLRQLRSAVTAKQGRRGAMSTH